MQHFLLSAAARTLSLKAVFRMGEDKAYQTFCELRWPKTDGEAVCPRCGCTESYAITTRASSSALPAITSSASRAARFLPLASCHSLTCSLPSSFS
jgi:hypothetical protein